MSHQNGPDQTKKIAFQPDSLYSVKPKILRASGIIVLFSGWIEYKNKKQIL